MIVCHCKGLTDRDVRSAVRCGAMTRGSVARACGAGAECGGCRPAIEEIIEQALAGDSFHVELTLVEIREPAAAAG